MNMKSEIGKINAQLRDELKEHGDMDYETMSRIVGERDDALDERAAALDRRAAVIDERAAALDERAAVIDERAAALDERDGEETERPPFGCSPACNHICTGGLNENEKMQAVNGVKNRIWGIMGKIKDGVLFGASAIKIWESSQSVFLMVLSVLGCS